MIRIQDILDKVAEYHPEDTEVVRKAYVYAAAAHAGQTRLSGEPYLSHPLAVAYSLAAMRLDGASVAAGLLHDTVEDHSWSFSDFEGVDSSDTPELARIQALEFIARRFRYSVASVVAFASAS